MKLQDLKLASALTAGLMIGILLPVGVLGYYRLATTERDLRNRSREEQQQIVELLAIGMQDHVWNLMPDNAQPLLQLVMRDPRITEVIITSDLGGEFLHAERPERRQGESMILERDIMRGGKTIGHVKVEVNTRLLLHLVHEVRLTTILTILAQLLVSLGTLWILVRYKVLLPIKRLLVHSTMLGKKQLATPFVWERQDEFGFLGRSLEQTREALLDLFTKLEAHNHALQSEKERYLSLLNHLPDSVLLHDQDLIVFANPAAKTLLGDGADLHGRRYIHFVHPDEQEEIRTMARQLMDLEKPISFGERRLISIKGNKIIAKVHAIPFHQGTGDVFALIVIENITEKVAARKEQERLNQLLHESVEVLNDGFAVFGRNRRLELCNSSFAEFFKQDPETMVGAHLWDLVRQGSHSIKSVNSHPIENADEYMTLRKLSFESGDQQPMEVELKDGRTFLLTNRVKSDGGIVFVRTETTSLKKAELAAVEGRSKSEMLEAIAFPLVLIKLDDMTILHLNEPAANLLDVGLEATIGQTVPEAIIDPHERERINLALSQNEVVDGIELRMTSLKGRQFWAMISARRFYFQGCACVLMGCLDMTDRKLAEKQMREAKDAAEKAYRDLAEAQEHLVQSEKLASLGGLVAGIAHEINTPIGITLTATTLLDEKTRLLHSNFENQSLSEKQFRDYLKVTGETLRLMVTNINRAANLIHSFKQVAVDQTGGSRRTFDLADYVEEVVASLQPYLRRAPHRLVLACARDVKMNSFPGAISQVITNFVINALLHAFKEGEAGIIGIETQLVDQDHVEILFSDNGMGIPQEIKNKIFDPFFTTKRGEGGSGLGLHLVFNLVTGTLCGKIHVESQSGSGTSFRVVLPLNPTAGEQSHDDPQVRP